MKAPAQRAFSDGPWEARGGYCRALPRAAAGVIATVSTGAEGEGLGSGQSGSTGASRFRDHPPPSSMIEIEADPFVGERAAAAPMCPAVEK